MYIHFLKCGDGGFFFLKVDPLASTCCHLAFIDGVFCIVKPSFSWSRSAASADLLQLGSDLFGLLKLGHDFIVSVLNRGFL